MNGQNYVEKCKTNWAEDNKGMYETKHMFIVYKGVERKDVRQINIHRTNKSNILAQCEPLIVHSMRDDLGPKNMKGAQDIRDQDQLEWFT